jgi:hypothetical protein
LAFGIIVLRLRVKRELKSKKFRVVPCLSSSATANDLTPRLPGSAPPPGSITDTVSTDSWAGTKGGKATLARNGLRLYIRQTGETHRQIANLLEQLREEKFNEGHSPARNRDMLTDDGHPGAAN